jgi:hypothetical protein
VQETYIYVGDLWDGRLLSVVAVFMSERPELTRRDLGIPAALYEHFPELADIPESSELPEEHKG